MCDHEDLQELGRDGNADVASGKDDGRPHGGEKKHEIDHVVDRLHYGGDLTVGLAGAERLVFKLPPHEDEEEVDYAQAYVNFEEDLQGSVV